MKHLKLIALLLFVSINAMAQQKHNFQKTFQALYLPKKSFFLEWPKMILEEKCLNNSKKENINFLIFYSLNVSFEMRPAPAAYAIVSFKKRMV